MSSHSSPLSPLSANTPSICIQDTTSIRPSPRQSPLILPAVQPSTSSPSPVLSSRSSSVSHSVTSPSRTSRSLSTSTQATTMSSRTSRQTSLSSTKKSPSLSKKSKASAKEADWSEITDPEERRRVQNRIAQRKFREKTRENKEKSQRDAHNLEHAGNCYRTPGNTETLGGSSFSGLPWGGMDLGFVISKGFEHESQRSSGRGTYDGDDNGRGSINYHYSHNQPINGGGFGGSTGSDDIYMSDKTFSYDAPPIPYPPVPSFSLTS